MTQIEVIQSDITTLDVDCIVNAANEYLARGSGVCGAIHKAAGDELATECRAIGFCKTGDAVLTKGYHLKSKYVIHAVGPVYDEHPNTTDLLKSAYLNTLELAEQNQISSLAFPCISTGVFGFPNLVAAQIAVQTTSDFLKRASRLKKVIFCCFLKVDFQIYTDLINKK